MCSGWLHGAGLHRAGSPWHASDLEVTLTQSCDRGLIPYHVDISSHCCIMRILAPCIPCTVTPSCSAALPHFALRHSALPVYCQQVRGMTASPMAMAGMALAPILCLELALSWAAWRAASRSTPPMAAHPPLHQLRCRYTGLLWPSSSSWLAPSSQ